MEDLVYRHNSIAEENIEPNRHPAKNAFDEWGEEVTERTDLGYKDNEVISEEEREKRIREMDEIIKEDLE